MQGCVEWVSKYSINSTCTLENGSLGNHCTNEVNSACTQSLNECSGSTSVTTAKVAPSSHLAQHLNLTHNPRISCGTCVSNSNLESTPSQEASPAQDSKIDSESHKSAESPKDLESRFKNIDSNLESNATESKSKTISESKKLTESTTPQNLNKALPDSNNGCDSTDLAELQNCAIFAEQKSDSNMSHEVQTAPRPCRGVKNALRKCRSAFLAFLTRQGYSEALPPKDILCGCRKEKRRFIFFGAKGSGEGINPFFFCENKRVQKDKEVFVGQEILRNEEIQNLGNTENPRGQNLASEQIQNLDSQIPLESQVDSQKSKKETSQGESIKNTFARFYTAFRHTRFYTLLCWLLTFNFINITWIFFRAENIQGALNLIKGMFGGVVVLPSFLESKLGFLGSYYINGVAVGFGKWAEAIEDSSMIVIPSVLGALLLCVWGRNSIELLRAFVPRLRALAFGVLLFYTALFMLGAHATTEFLYFNF